MSNLFGFPSGLSGGSKETEYTTNFNTSHTTAYTTNWNTSQGTSRGTSHGTSRNTSYTSNFQTSTATQGDSPTSRPVNQGYGDVYLWVTSGGGHGFKFGAQRMNNGTSKLYVIDWASSYISNLTSSGNGRYAYWTCSESEYLNWVFTLSPSNCWIKNHGGFSESTNWNSSTQKASMMSNDYGSDSLSIARKKWGCDHLAGYARSIEHIFKKFMEKFVTIDAENYGGGLPYTDPSIEDFLADRGVPPAYARGDIFRKRHEDNTTMIIAEGSKPHSNLSWYYDQYGGDVGGYGDFRTSSFQNSLPTRELGAFYKYGNFRVVVFPNIDDTYSMQTGSNTSGANNIYTNANGFFYFSGGADRYNVANYGWYNTYFDTGNYVSKSTSWSTNYTTNWSTIWGTSTGTQRVTTYSTNKTTSHITYG